MNHFLLTTGVIPVGSVRATMGAIAGEEFPAEIIKQARQPGKKRVRSWEERVVPPEAEEAGKAFEDRMRRLMLFRKKDWPYEYEFWRTHRGLK
jgi:hypothetical protein